MASDSITGAETIRWDLQSLYADPDALERDLESAASDARSFRDRYRSRVSGLDAASMAEALAMLGSIQDRIGRAYTYAYLDWSTDTADAARGALLQRVREAYTALSQDVLFFELEWADRDEAEAEALLPFPALAPYRHWLEIQRLHKPYLLTEPEEKILVEKSVTGRGAWERYFDETMGSARYVVRGVEKTQQEVLALLHERDRDLRRDAALGFTEGLVKQLRTSAFIFNTILADKASDDRLRGYPTWISSRNRSNEVPDEVVEALVASVSGRYELVGRFYRLKAGLLGISDLQDYDRYAPVGEAATTYPWDRAREVVVDAYEGFHPEMGRITRRFFDERWIDAALAPNKRSGAFSHGAVPSAHPFVLMNYTGRVRDVQTLAHELGHGVHQYLSRSQGIFHADTPLTTAETASVFGEMLVFQRLLSEERDPRNRLAMLVAKIDDTVATVFRQVAMNRFEHRIHTGRRERGELSVDAFAEAWLDTQQAMFDGSVTLGDHYRHWWSYIPHFLHTPGYVYAYAFGELLVLALYARYLEVGPTFADRYLELLASGGSDWPHVLVGRLGIDLTDRAFWEQGLAAIENLVAEAESLATASA